MRSLVDTFSKGPLLIALWFLCPAICLFERAGKWKHSNRKFSFLARAGEFSNFDNTDDQNARHRADSKSLLAAHPIHIWREPILRETLTWKFN